MREEKEVKVGDRVKVYNMWTKRKRIMFVVDRKGKKLELSKVKNGGASDYAFEGGVEIVEERRRR